MINKISKIGIAFGLITTFVLIAITLQEISCTHTAIGFCNNLFAVTIAVPVLLLQELTKTNMTETMRILLAIIVSVVYVLLAYAIGVILEKLILRKEK